ncbi:MAG: methyltransferase domain-containing protein [Alphaproteobacteria bacterium]|nr:methyltransferase domain-containing protein [Alphaproteobacteria bacterium]
MGSRARSKIELTSLANRGAAAAEAGLYAAAIADFLAVYGRSGAGGETQQRAARNLANCYLALGDIAASLQYSRAALAIDPADVRAALVFARGLAQQGGAESLRQAELILDALDSSPHPFDPREVLLHRVQVLVKLGQLDSAVEQVQAGLDRMGSSPGLLFALGEVLGLSGQMAAAGDAFRRCLESDPTDRYGAAAAWSRLQGETPPQLSREFVTQLFDDYAPRFDRDLARLDYRVPELIFAAVEGFLPRRRLLDLGCGTGLGAVAFAQRVPERVGVDLSPKMIDAARARGLYHRLEAAEITEFLKAEAETLAQARYDLVLAADVLVYCGDLSTIFSLLARLMGRGGIFAFSVESFPAAESRDYELTEAMRFRHSDDYVTKTLQNSRFLVKFAHPITPRRDRGQPVLGKLFVAEFQ